MRYLVLVVALAIAACGEPRPVSPPRFEQVGLAEDAPALRVRADKDHNRLWVLGDEHVNVYDIAKKRLIRRIPLPGWWVADLLCPPDMVIDRSGTVFISHNIEPKLWRIATDDFHLTAHAVRLPGREDLDIGFGALALDADGTLFGVAATGGTLWRIDIERGSARQVELDSLLPDACALTMR